MAILVRVATNSGSSTKIRLLVCNVLKSCRHENICLASHKPQCFVQGVILLCRQSPPPLVSVQKSTLSDTFLDLQTCVRVSEITV